MWKPKPNETKYYDEKYGSFMNEECSICKVPTWSPILIQTLYIGKKFFHNRTNKVLGVIASFDGDLYCNQCWENTNASKTD